MKPSAKRVLILLFVIISIFLFNTPTFAKYENIKAVVFKDGNVVSGKVMEMNSEQIKIVTKDGQVIIRKFDDVKHLVRGDDSAGRERKARFLSNVAIGAERMSGHTTYQIGYPYTHPDGTQESGYFPFSQLEWPLDVWLARMDANFNLGRSWRINGVFKKNLSLPGDNMKDSDWLTASDPSRLDVYSESNISKFNAWIIDVDLEWVFLQQQSWSLYAGVGYQYQKLNYDAKLIHQYSPSGLPGYEAYGDNRIAITYEMRYEMPYLKVGTDLKFKDKFTLDGSFAWSPIVKAKDEDNHLLRENGGKIMTGNMDGHAYMISVSARYDIASSWFLKGGFQYTRITVDGDQYQVYGNGTAIGTVKEESESRQSSGYLTVGYIF